FVSLLSRFRLRSRLFPYTTLFRSQEQFSSIGEKSSAYFAFLLQAFRLMSYKYRFSLFALVKHNQTYQYLLWLHLSMRQVNRLPLDRKSTRLNSSHVSISYAVFCLK